LRLCRNCSERLNLQDDFEHLTLEVHDLAERGEHNRALGLLEGAWQEYRARDRDDWLKGAILAEEGFILERAGRLNEALEKYRSLRELGFHPSGRFGYSESLARSEYITNQIALARLVEKLYTRADAIREIESALESGQTAGDPVPNTLDALAEYARLARRVPVRYKPLLVKVSDWWGVPGPSQSPHDEVSLAAAVQEAWAARNGAAQRFAMLLQEARAPAGGGVPAKEAVELVERYIESEPVGFFRAQGEHLLDELGKGRRS
jgi:hypothetical protein